MIILQSTLIYYCSNTMNKRTLCFCIFLACFYAGEAQIVKGVVVDQESGKPIKRALVFIDNSTIGAITDVAGQFSLSYHESQRGATLVCASSGYELQKRPISEFPSGFVDTFVLSQSVRHNEENLADASERWRLRDERIKRFVRLIGDRNNYVRIENTEYLQFRENDGELIAKSSEPITIINKDLGYEITFFLEHFWTNENDDLQFRGSLYFQELNGGGYPTKANMRSRLQAYRALPKYFFTHLAHHKLTQQFPWEIQLADRVDREFVNHQLVEEFDLPISRRGEGLYVLELDQYLMICNATKKKETPVPNSAVRSLSGLIVFDSYGKVLNPGEIEYAGRWGEQRAGYFLPEDYQPPENLMRKTP